MKSDPDYPTSGETEQAYRFPEIQQDRNRTQPPGHTGQPLPHDSAHKHVTGEAIYVDDRMPATQHYYACVGGSTLAHGRITALDLAAVRAAEGVVDVITAADIPGELDIGPVFPGDPLLCPELVEYYGQPIFAVAATTHELARKAAKLAVIEYQILTPVLDLQTALDQAFYVRPPHTMARGDASAAIGAATHRVTGQYRVGGQEHFYLEGQISTAEPAEDGGMTIHSSTQNPTETQKLVAAVLNLPMNRVEVIVRRMGGGFGGKEVQGGQWSCIAALLAHRLGAAVTCRLARADDMIMTGKRHNFLNRYEAGFDADGRITGLRHRLAAQCGYSPDLSDAVVDRAMFQSDNAYYLPNVEIVGLRCKTHTVSNTAFRGFGAPQGLLAMETVIDHIAWQCGMDPLDVRKANLYDTVERNITPYYQQIEAFQLGSIIDELEQTADYRARRRAIKTFNTANPVLKKGLALTPVKFGISFTIAHLNQAGALLHVYNDGSIHLNHGGTEMGQGLLIKVAQIVAEEFGVDIARVTVSATRTDKVPNTSATAASSGTDLNGMAARNAARTIRQRLTDFLAEKYGCAPELIDFRHDRVTCGDEELDFGELAHLAWLNRIPLSATGYYRTPKIHYDRATARGRPFYYFAQGAAVSEVVIDTLTGESRLLRVDILHDVGNSLNPAVDIGQIEGAFIQGLGWLTCEQLHWDASGQLMTTSPATYKIPAISDTPPVFKVKLLPNQPNEEATIYRSKAVGEPPLLLAVSAWCAIRDAIGACGDGRVFPELQAPATPEQILATIHQIQGRPWTG